MGKKGGWFSAVKKAFVISNNNDPKESQEEKKPEKTEKTASKKSWFGKEKSVETDSSQPETASAFATPALRSPPPDIEDDPELEAETSESAEPENEPSKPLEPPENEPSKPTKPEIEQKKPTKPENEQKKPTKPEIEQKKPTKPENEPSKPGYKMAFATSRAAVAFRRILGKSKEEVAAIKVQSAFRRFLARRRLRSLKGLVRLKVLVQSQSVKRQAITTLRCMQTLARVQSQVRARRIRMSEENQALQRQLMQKRERELDNMKSYLGNDWDNTRRSKEQIVATMQHKETAAARRERALSYAQTQQQMWKNPSKSANPTFMDPNNPQWGWSWLDRWMAARPWESQTEGPTENEQPDTKLTRSSSFGDSSQKLDQSPTISSPRSPSKSNRRLTLSSPKSPASSPQNRRHSISNSAFRQDSPDRVSSPSASNRRLTLSSPKGINDPTLSPRNRRHSISNSSLQEVSSPRASSPRVSSPRSMKTKSMVPTPSQVRSPNRSPTLSPLGSKKPSSAPANRRMSLSGTSSTSGGGGRRLSMSSRVGPGTR